MTKVPHSELERHVVPAGSDGHWEDFPGGRKYVEYAVYECVHCGKEVATRANWETKEEWLIDVADHMNTEHPEKLDK